MELVDSHGRRINYLRLSVTDRCNLRCSYCMPAEGVRLLPHRDILTYEEFLRVAEAAVSLGIEKIRVTGGEPLVRKGIVPFLSRLAQLPGLKYLALTTNGLLLADKAAELKEAGIQALNISIDSLQPATYARITRGGELGLVLAGIEAATRADFRIKLNMVVMRGVNLDEVAEFAALTLDRPWAVRFIEYMPVVREEGWQALSVPGTEVLARIAARYRLQPHQEGEFAGPARDFRIDGAVGTIGVITPIYGHFCASCNRIRVKADGTARSCLFSAAELDLKPYLRDGAARLEDSLHRLVATKPGRHPLAEQGERGTSLTMSRIGG
jgi:cyclic pyranopterin phosphate synthase